MNPDADWIRAELAQIFRNECWLEGERRGRPVHSRDPVVRLKVADIILAGAGAAIRERLAHRNALEQSDPHLAAR